MAYFAHAFARKAGTTLDLFREIYGGRQSKSGRNVSVSTAIEVSTVYACCRVVGEGVAQVPLKLMRETPDGRTRQPARDHRLYNKLAIRPNRWQTSFEFREMLVWHAMLAGNAYSFINRMGGQIIELFPFAPGAVEVKHEDNGDLQYVVTADDGSKKPFPAESIWHLRGPSWNSWYGLETLKLARESIGLAMATEESVARLHKNGIRPSGTYSVEGVLPDGKYKELAKWLDERMAGVENDGRPMILDRAAKWSSTQMTGVDAQTIENRRYQIEEICRFARVMPIMVGYSDKTATFASAEQMFIAHVVHTLAPWYERIEQSLNANLLTEREREQGYYFNFVEEGLLRGSLRDTKDTILGYVNGGLLTPNEGRAKLDQNPDSDPASDQLRVPANIVGDASKPSDNPDASGDAAKRMAAMEIELKHLADRQPPAINVDARTTVTPAAAPVFTVHLPEQKAGTVQVDVAAPVIHVQPPEVNVPATVVHVEVPKADAPVINVDVPPAEVIVHLPARKTDTTVTYDKHGNIVKAQQLEQDA